MAASLKSILKSAVVRSYNEELTPKFSPIIMCYCNAAEPYSFSRAYIDFKEHFVNLNLLTWFANGFKKIVDAILGKDTFKGKNTFENLKHIFNETKHLECLTSLLKSETKQSEAKVRNILAAHYFQPLAYDSCCVIDRGTSTICEHCKLELTCDDTSMGSPQLWHGRADILLKNSTIKIALSEDDDEDDGHDVDLASGEPATKSRKKEESNFSSTIEVKLEKTDSSSALVQALAETIVNAFCEAKRDKSLFKKFVSSFLATEKYIRIILYNCQSDILLLSYKLEIWNSDNTLNFDTMLLVWMAVNFDNFEMNLDEKILKVVKYSNFKNLVGDHVHSKYINNVSKPCPEYKPRNIGNKRNTPQPDGSFHLAREIDYEYYSQVHKLTSALD